MSLIKQFFYSSLAIGTLDFNASRITLESVLPEARKARFAKIDTENEFVNLRLKILGCSLPTFTASSFLTDLAAHLDTYSLKYSPNSFLGLVGQTENSELMFFVNY